MGAQYGGKRAAKWGGIASLLVAARGEVGIIYTVVHSGKAIGNAVAYTVGASIVPLILVIAGVRLLQGKGRVSGSIAALLLVFDLAFRPWGSMTLLETSASIISLALLIVLLNGVRGSFAVHASEKRVREVFD
jgi:hypothetical protein